ncbi:MAG: hypothetical protein RMI43_07370 [Candidatus Caldarchaeum sp.]|nr:hypothetical protein [Candidatus Caldarchaeum sp.]
MVLADTAIDMEMVKLLASAAKSLGAQPLVAVYETREEVDLEPPQHVGEAMKASDVIVSLPLMYILHTRTYNEAMKAGARILELTGTTPDMMVRLIGRVDYGKMCELGDALTELTKKARKVRLTSASGTDLVFENDPNRPVFHNDGIMNRRGFYKPLGGQISWAPVEESFDGVLVVDTFIWPPAELGVLRNPVKILMKNGRVSKIEGGVEARVFEKWLSSFGDDKMYQVAHASWGFHPKAKLTGMPLEDERLYAGMEFGFGAQSLKFQGKLGLASAHTDVGLYNPNVYFDDVLVASNGRFVHEKLQALDKVLKG